MTASSGESNKVLDTTQELYLKHVWASLLKFWGNEVDDSQVVSLIAKNRSSDSKTDSKKSTSFFGGWGGGSSSAKNDDKHEVAHNPFTKYHLEKKESECLFWNLLNTESPDSFILRFLRARKWHEGKALSMLVRSLHWRVHDANTVEIINHGECYAYKHKKEGLIKNLEMQKVVHSGYDLKGRPILMVRVKLHYSKDQSEEELEYYALLIIEQTRLFMKEPNRAATILFDMTDFSMSNMDYTPVKFLIKIFEAHYPEYLGNLIIHNAPWLFSPIWNVVKTWLDPVVASKVKFTYNVKDLSKYMSNDQIPQHLNGTNDLKLNEYIPIDGSADTKLKDKETFKAIMDERDKIIHDLYHLTVDWIQTTDTLESKSINEKRKECMARLSDNYSTLDPYIRSRCEYDLTGILHI
ncbi:hypothetical protein Kpol_483p8 [Vanderwaltozyma polyspora DSM 70294]|uniref:CRAL-TRIO domain-containing protein n=1 Tax=Vanderwaltozyma polyspora (strain ATCC 22028 / DSM 70294 / BCRC 21397 / CBS 2163 / NBRC 10782 / NRRL Y-8283 / UCD 57-17) TaxID=436907 RepID=A7TQ60_VANPO|nr:uncharacterized protein Kpol_483p8 [Vanderwaltozyma polyspora DSM 70294]EDO15589.1 hypothetical protein Kpol_483p8 [Vanderwaltozyma polyspora DSM 70294]